MELTELLYVGLKKKEQNSSRHPWDFFLNSYKLNIFFQFHQNMFHEFY